MRLASCARPSRHCEKALAGTAACGSLAGKGELDEVEKCFDRQILANREASFRMPDMPADILLQPEPNPTQVRDIMQNVRVSRGLLQASPVKGKPIGNSMIEVQLEYNPTSAINR
jgi:hypothetical protein